MHEVHSLVRLQRRERHDPRFAAESHNHNIMGLTVWGAIACGSWSQRYVDDVLEPCFLLYIRRDLGVILKQDNARSHITTN